MQSTDTFGKKKENTVVFKYIVSLRIIINYNNDKMDTYYICPSLGKIYKYRKSSHFNEQIIHKLHKLLEEKIIINI